jgi:hypothetical protein
MRKRLWFVVAAVALVGVVGGSLMLPSAASSETPSIGAWGKPKGWSSSGQSVSIQSHEGGQTIRVREVPLNEKFINVDGRGLQPGDYVVFREALVRNGRRVGILLGNCTVQFPTNRRVFTIQCDASATLSGRGEITAAGRAQFSQNAAPDATLAITGGTGHFQNVRGEVHLTERGSIFHLLP